MPVQKHATNSSLFTELFDLLNIFPCPAWIEDASGRILVRTARKVAGTSRSRHGRQDAPPTLKKTVFPLTLPGEYTGKLPVPREPQQALRLVALFPAGQETECQCGIIVALLAKALRERQSATVDIPNEARSLTTLLASLTPCQSEIYRELVQGYSNKEIADHLGISHTNVRVQIHRMRKKLGPGHIPFQRKGTAADC